jgi:hypothetical protein
MTEATTCLVCEKLFKPRRSTARFCSPRCRLSAHRASTPAAPPRARQEAAGAFLSVSGHRDTRVASKSSRETLTQRKLPSNIVPDEKWPGMYRVRRPDGSLSDMVNLTRAKDALAAMEEKDV